MDLILRNVIWLDRSGRLRQGNIQVGGQRILRADGNTLDRPWPASPGTPRPTPPLTFGKGYIQGEGRLLCLPGIIDSHVHFRQPGDALKEGLANGSRAALKGGVTTVLDMPNNRPPCTTTRRLEQKNRLFNGRCRVNWGLHAQAVPRRRPALHGALSGKIYMARSSPLPAVTGHEALCTILSNWPTVTLHAEHESFFVPEACFHDERRPMGAVSAALAAVEKALRSLTSDRRPRLVLCHIASRLEVDWLRRMKRDGFSVWGETCPHYCLLTQKDARASGGKLKVNPPLRTPDDRAAVLTALANCTIDFLATDHAPHTPREKADTNAPSGIPGIEWFGPAALHLVRSRAIDWQRYYELTCAGPSHCYNLVDRDGIGPGNFADLAIYHPACPSGTDRITTRAGYNPFAHLELPAGPLATIVNGSLQYVAGKFPGEAAGLEVQQ
jgi:dihydroorotase